MTDSQSDLSKTVVFKYSASTKAGYNPNNLE